MNSSTYVNHSDWKIFVLFILLFCFFENCQFRYNSNCQFVWIYFVILYLVLKFLLVMVDRGARGGATVEFSSVQLRTSCESHLCGTVNSYVPDNHVLATKAGASVISTPHTPFSLSILSRTVIFKNLHKPLFRSSFSGL